MNALMNTLASLNPLAQVKTNSETANNIYWVILIVVGIVLLVMISW